MKFSFIIALVTLVLPRTCDSRTHVEDSGTCVYSFQVWSPDGDVLTKIQDLEYSCRNSSLQMERQILEAKLEFGREMQLVGNAANSFEKALLEQRLEQMRLSGIVEKLRLELPEMRNENDRLLHMCRQLIRGSSNDSKITLPSVDSTKDMYRLEDKVGDNSSLLSQLKSGVADLKAEWLLIKREVQNILFENSQLKKVQDAVRDDTMKLKEMIEGLRVDSASLKAYQSQLKASQDKLEDVVGDVKETESWLGFHGDTLQEQMQKLSRQVAELQSQGSQLKKELIAVALAARNFSGEEIGEWLLTLPGLNVPSVKPLETMSPRGKVLTF